MFAMIINGVGLIIIASIIWWFWLYRSKPKQVTDKKVIDIVVDGGSYTPSTIRVKQNQAIELRFTRKDPNPCAAYVIFDKLKISQLLEVNKVQSIHLNNKDKGEFDFTCEMGMYRGKIIVD